MSIISWIGKIFKNEGGTRSISIDELAEAMNRGLGLSDSGVNVTPETAMRQATFYSCVGLIADSISQLPLILYNRTPKGRKRAPDHPLYDLLKTKPNDYQTASEYWQWVTACLLTRGVSYSQKITMGDRLIALNPLPNNSVVEKFLPGNIPIYEVHTDAGRVVTFAKEDIFCIKGLTLDGKTPVSPVGYMRNSLGLSISAEQFGSRFFGNNARPAGILETEGSLDQTAVDALKKNWGESHSGENMHKVAVLHGGLKFKPVTMSAEDSQFLETRQFQRSEICGIFRVPPHMIGDTEKTTSWGTGVEQLTIGFIKFTLGSWLMRIEQTIERDLLSKKDRKTFYPEFLTENMLRGDLKSRNEAYKIALGGTQNPGYMTQNEVRRLENKEPLDGGDTLFSPVMGERTNENV